MNWKNNRTTNFLLTVCIFVCSGLHLYAQDCKTTADLDAVPGKYLTAAQYPWPAARAEYFINLKSAADKAVAKRAMEQVEKIELKSRSGFTLTGGNWENTYSSTGYQYAGNIKLGNYYFQSASHEFFCRGGKLIRNSEYSSVLRIYINSIPVNTLDRFLRKPFGTYFGDYDFGLQYLDWKNHKPANTDDQLIKLCTYFSSNNKSLIEAINSGINYFQDVPEKDIKQNTRVPYIYRYWFIKKSTAPVLVAVSRKEYLQSLLEYYEREKLYFPKLIEKLTKENNSSVKQYQDWEITVNEKIEIVKKVLATEKEEWLAAQATINQVEDQAKNYKAQFKERTNHKRFWQFYESEKKTEALYKYNPDYFKTSANGAAAPQLMTVVFRYVTIPSSLRLLNNFTEKFDTAALLKMLQ